MLRTTVTLIALLFGLVADAHAWSYKEHILFARLAASRLLADPTTPPAMKDWLRVAIPDSGDMTTAREFFLTGKVGIDPVGFTGIALFTIKPDMHALKDQASSRIEPFGVHEKRMHYITFESFITGDGKREYRDDLSGKPAISAFPRDMKDPRYVQAGMLPFRVEYCYGMLVESIKAGRLGSEGPAFDDEPDNAIRWAGYLAHYLADNTQPQHATEDYKSSRYFSNRRLAPNVHAEMEYRMCDDEKHTLPELRAEFWEHFERALKETDDPVKTDDLFLATLEVASISYDCLPLIGKAAAASNIPDPGNKAGTIDTTKFFHYPGMMEMKARQTAWAVKRIEREWRRAWKDATE